MEKQFLASGTEKNVYRVGNDFVQVEARKKWSREEALSAMHLAKIAHLLFPINTPQPISVREDKDTGKYALVFEYIDHENDIVHKVSQKIKNTKEGFKGLTQKEVDDLVKEEIRNEGDVKAFQRYSALEKNIDDAGLSLLYEVREGNIIKDKNRIPVFIDFGPAFRSVDVERADWNFLNFDPDKLVEYIDKNTTGIARELAMRELKAIFLLMPEEKQKFYLEKHFNESPVISEIKEQEKGYTPFFESFRTCFTLGDILEGHNVPGLEWLDRDILIKRLERIRSVFQNKFKGKENFNINFWVYPNKEADDKKFAEIYEVRKKYNEKFTPKLEEPNRDFIGYTQLVAMWREYSQDTDGKQSFQPLNNFSGLFSWDEQKEHWNKQGIDLEKVIGRTIINIPKIYEVSNQVASEIFVNDLAHDIMHYFLPIIGPYHELLHKVLVNYVLGAEQNNKVLVDTTWDKFVFDAVCDPFFFLRSVETYPKGESVNQKYFVAKMRNWYNAKNKVEKMRNLWGTETPTQELIAQRCEQLLHDNCKQYAVDEGVVDWGSQK